MYLFFTLFGFLFIFLCSIGIYFIYEVFSINKVTNFLNPTLDTTWNRINITVIPILIWGYIELPILGSNSYFLSALILNTCVSSSVMYVIRYGNLIFNDSSNKFVDIMSIFVGTILGQIIMYIMLLIGLGSGNGIWISIIGILVYTAFIFMLKVYPPKSEFFRGSSK